MAFDISIGEQAGPSLDDGPELIDFATFYERNAPLLKIACHLVAQDPRAADRAFERTAANMAHHWPRLAAHPNRLGWGLDQAIDEIGRIFDSQTSRFADKAAGGYLRGLTLDEAVQALPIRQRGALVAAYFFGWSDDHTAAGADVEELAITTRRRRALSFVTHHLKSDLDQAQPITDLLARRASRVNAEVPDSLVIRRRGRRKKIAARAAVATALLGAIAVAGLVLSVDRTNYDLDIHTPDEVAPPGTVDWFGPVSDGRGGFIALNTTGASRFAASDDGAVWFEETTWNSRSVNLRTEISAFVRSGDRYIATIEEASALSSSVSPFVASSRDLRAWEVNQIDVGQRSDVEGLRTRADVISTVATTDRLLVGVATSVTIDHASLDVRPSEVCRETATETTVEISLCDGSLRTIDTSGDGQQLAADASPSRLFVQEGSGLFVETPLPPGGDPSSIVSFDDGFAMVDGTSGAVLVSASGRAWERAYAPAEPNRFMLLASSTEDRALVVQPEAREWTAFELDADSVGSPVTLPISIDPALVWIKPQLASGPAGWAIFVTTSRPWERAESTRGWAVEVEEWVVSRQPNARVITARSTDGTVTHKYAVRLDNDPEVETADGLDSYVERPGGEAVTLLDPETGEVLVQVSQQLIDDSRPSIDSATTSEAQVLFSADGRSWRTIWQSSTATWLGSVAVGDDEVVLSGTKLTGPPIAIPLSGE